MKEAAVSHASSSTLAMPRLKRRVTTQSLQLWLPERESKVRKSSAMLSLWHPGFMHDTYMMSDTFTTCANALLTSCDEASLHAEQALKAAAAAAAKAAAANVITYFAPDPPAKSAQAEAHGEHLAEAEH